MFSTNHGFSKLRGGRPSTNFRIFYLALFMLILVCLIIVTVFQIFIRFNIEVSEDNIRDEPAEVVISSVSLSASPAVTNCTFHTCFDIYNCGYSDSNRIKIYVYSPARYVDEQGRGLVLPPSKEFNEILATVVKSEYYTSDPARACLFLPTVDLLNQNSISLEHMAKILASFPRWNDGANHILFNMLPGSMPHYNTVLDVDRGKAILAGGGFSTWTYRRTYDVSIPVFNPFTAGLLLSNYCSRRSWLVVSAQFGLHSEYKQDLSSVARRHQNFLLLDRCKHFNTSERCKVHADDQTEVQEKFLYPHILQEATFCLVIRSNRLGQMALSDCMLASSIPVIAANSYILPFSEVLDWKRAAIILDEEDLPRVVDILQNVSSDRIAEMRQQVRFFWERYMSSIGAITLTSLQIINDRVFPYAAQKYEDWNEPRRSDIQNPLFLPLIPAKMAGFTAVILTYDRLESLFKIIQQVTLAPSLAKVLVVWNNQQKAPPQAHLWPKINKPLKVVQTRHNRLSNRFYPYEEIETEAILALDDDILMLTTDELEFGYEVWREFSDRLVGFPSRLHIWDNTTNAWRYESEWTSEISMVLTGAAFYHKYYNFLYTNTMPGNIKSWVDEHMNCEDIAFNFLIANTTGKPPIKVTPRQKFKCPECSTAAMISGDMGDHMVERSECINRFTNIYGMMPLQTVEFRADPVLYKDPFPNELKWFSDVGSL